MFHGLRKKINYYKVFMSNNILLMIGSLVGQGKKINGLRLQEKSIKDHQIKFLDNQNNVENVG